MTHFHGNSENLFLTLLCSVLRSHETLMSRALNPLQQILKIHQLVTSLRNAATLQLAQSCSLRISSRHA